MTDNDAALLLQMVRDLSVKLDGLPTRHEFDLVNGRLGRIQESIDKYVLASEFSAYKWAIEQQLQTMTRQFAKEQDGNFENADGRLETLEDDVDKLKSNRIPAWALPSVSLLLALITIAVNVWTAVFHPLVPSELHGLQQFQQVPPAITQRAHQP